MTSAEKVACTGDDLWLSVPPLAAMQVPAMATHRTASHVVQRALTYSDERGQARIVQAGSSVLVSCCLNGTVDDDDHSCR